MDPAAPIEDVGDALLRAARMATDGQLSSSDAEAVLAAAWRALKGRHDLLAAADAMPSPHMVAMVALTVAGARAPEHIQTPGLGFRAGQPAALHVAVVGQPGAGKSATTGAIRWGMRPAQPVGEPDCTNTEGSPKTTAGLVASFFKQESILNPQTKRWVASWDRGVFSVLWMIDEYAAFHAYNTPSEPLSATMCTMWSGGRVGDSLKDKSQTLTLEAGSYRSSLVVSVQPEKAAGLLSHKGQGFTQRALFTRADTTKPPAPPGMLPATAQAVPSPGMSYTYTWSSEPMSYADGLPGWIEYWLGLECAELDTHHIQLACRVGTLLAAVQGRHVIEWHDLRLGMALVAMCRIVRDAFVVPAARAAGEAEAAQRGALDAVRQDSRESVLNDRSFSRVAKAASAAAAGDSCSDGDPEHTFSVLAKSLSREQRQLLAEPRNLTAVRLAMDEQRPHRKHMVFAATPTTPIQVTCAPGGC